MISALKIPAYASFIQARDRALETILYNSQRRLTGVMRKTLHDMLKDLIVLLHGNPARSMIETTVRTRLREAVNPMVDEYHKAMQRAWILSAVGEAEAIARIKGEGNYHVTVPKRANILPVIEHYIAKLSNKVIDITFHSNGILKEDQKITLKKIMRALPKVRHWKSGKGLLPKQREAKSTRPEDVAVGFVDDNAWEDMVQDYLNANIPDTRGPEDILDKRTLPDEYKVPADEQVYGWEVEQQLTEDFVKTVRQAQQAGADTNGVDDFVWLAVLDNKTDDCCEWRDGLLTSEIEKALDGDHSDDECEAIVPPAHFNCRCRIAPAVSDAFEDVKSNAGEFEKWLKS